MVSILNPDLYGRFSTSEGMRMKLLSKEETSIVKAFLKVPIPEYVLAFPSMSSHMLMDKLIF